MGREGAVRLSDSGDSAVRPPAMVLRRSAAVESDGGKLCRVLAVYAHGTW